MTSSSAKTGALSTNLFGSSATIKAAIAWMIVLLAAGAAGYWANAARSATFKAIDPASVRGAAVAYDQLQCIESQIRTRMPAKAPIFVVSTDDYWRQRLTELATPWLDVRSTPIQARYLLDITSGDPFVCFGAELVITSP